MSEFKYKVITDSLIKCRELNPDGQLQIYYPASTHKLFPRFTKDSLTEISIQLYPDDLFAINTLVKTYKQKYGESSILKSKDLPYFYKVVTHESRSEFIHQFDTELDDLIEVIQYFREKGKYIKYLAFDLLFEYQLKTFSLVIIFHPEKFHCILSKIHERLNNEYMNVMQGDCLKARINYKEVLRMTKCNNVKDSIKILRTI